MTSRSAPIVVCCLIVLCSGVNAHATDFKLTEYVVKHVQHPRDLGAEVRNWAKSPYVQAAAKAFGVSEAAIAVAEVAANHIRSSGEEHYFAIPMPSGYSLCNLSAVMLSASKGGGSIGYWTNGNDLTSVVVGIWLKKDCATCGRNWVENKVSILSAPTNEITTLRASGECEAKPVGPADRVDWYSKYF